MAEVILLEGLGICEHCGALITTWEILEKAQEGWDCPHCKNLLTRKSFGYKTDGSRFGWVGPDGKWTTEKPKKDFCLGDWKIIVLNAKPALSV